MCKFKTEVKEIASKLRAAIDKNSALIKPAIAFVKIRPDGDVVLSVMDSESNLSKPLVADSMNGMDKALNTIIADSEFKPAYISTGIIHCEGNKSAICNAIFRNAE